MTPARRAVEQIRARWRELPSRLRVPGRIVVLSEREHWLLVHLLRSMVNEGRAGEPTRALIRQIERAEPLV